MFARRRGHRFNRGRIPARRGSASPPVYDPIFSESGGLLHVSTTYSETMLTNCGVTAPDDLTSSAWTKTQVTATNATTIRVDSTAPLVRQAVANAGADVPGVPLLVCFDARYDDVQWICVETRIAQATNRTWFDIQNGTVGTNGSSHVSPAIGAASGGWRRINLLVRNQGGVHEVIVRPVTADGGTTAPAANSTVGLRENPTQTGWVWQQRCYQIADRYTAQTDPSNTVWYEQLAPDAQPVFGPVPLYAGAADIGGIAALCADGAGRMLATLNAAQAAAMTGADVTYTLYLCARFHNDDLLSALFSVGNSGSTSGRNWGTTTTGGGRYRIQTISNAPATTSTDASVDIASDTSPKLLTYVDTGAASNNLSLYENSVVIPSLNGVTHKPGATTVDRSALLRFHAATATLPPNACLSEVLLFAGAHDATTRGRVETWLNDLHGGAFF